MKAYKQRIVIASPSTEGRGNLRDVEQTRPLWDCFVSYVLAMTTRSVKARQLTVSGLLFS